MRLEDARIEGGRLSFSVSPAEARQLVYNFKPGDYDIVPAAQKRSRNANDYCWWLCTEIANAVKVDKEQVYRDAITHVGIYKDFHSMDADEAKTLTAAWRKLGTGWICEQVDYEPDGDKVIIRAYYGSSTYNTRQMSRLIDWLVQEAESLEINIDNERIKSLLAAWEAKR